MHTTALIRLRTELRHFSRLSVLNHIFAALTITLGMIVIFRQIAPVLLHVMTRATASLSPIAVMAGIITTCAGIGWLRAIIRVAKEFRPIREESDARGDVLTDDELTSLIVRLLAYYRENRGAIRTMVAVSAVGGICFLLLGYQNALDYLSVTGNGTEFSADALFVIPVILLMAGIAVVSLLSSWYFSKYSRIWDRRITTSEQSEALLQQAPGDGTAMSGRRTVYEIYWEILVFCKTPRSFTGIINRCDLNSKTGQEYLEFLAAKGYLLLIREGERTSYVSSPAAGEYIALFSSLYQKLFDSQPEFRL